ncbi:MAG: hypothetical protein JNK82_01345 [Myxococcaceae bacterium]|nr:hypothetical protein [Myxococcaceae bacterium]
MLAFLISVSLLGAVDASGTLSSARKLADALRYEEAVVEYQRYLGSADGRPARERAAALFELGFIHLVLGDDANAQTRALEALELDPGLALPASAPARQVDFLADVKRQFSTRARVTVEQGDGPQSVRARLVDPEKKVKRVLLRHALAQNGPFYAAPMRCLGDVCTAELPSPEQGGDFTAWYYVEALDAKNTTIATAADAREPRQLAVIGGKPWYQSPITWGIAGGALVAVGIVVYLLAPPPPR